MFLVQNLSKQFITDRQSFYALNKISFCFPPGSHILLHGLNGSGKTTLLKCMGGLMLADEGTVSINDQAIFPSPINNDINQRHIGFVSSVIDSFYPRLTLYENLEFFCRSYFSTTIETQHAISSCIELFNLRDYTKVPFQHCSQGIKKRAGLIRGLIHQPDTLLIDEWDTALDTDIKEIFLSYLRNNNFFQYTICASHVVPSDIFFNAFIILHNGAAVFAGNIKEFFIHTGTNSLGEAIRKCIKIHA